MRGLGRWFRSRWSDLVTPAAFGVGVALIMFAGIRAAGGVSPMNVVLELAVGIMWGFAIYAYGTNRERRGYARGWEHSTQELQRIMQAVIEEERRR